MVLSCSAINVTRSRYEIQFLDSDCTEGFEPGTGHRPDQEGRYRSHSLFEENQGRSSGHVDFFGGR